MFTMMNRLYLKQIPKKKKKSQRNKNRLQESKYENTVCKASNTRPPKQCPNQQRLQKINRVLNILKSAGILFLPNQPHQTGQHHIPNRRRVYPQIILPSTKKRNNRPWNHPLYIKHQKNFIRHVRTYNEVKDDPLFLHHSGINHTN